MTHPSNFPASAAKRLLGAKGEILKSSTESVTENNLSTEHTGQSQIAEHQTRCPQFSVRQRWPFPVVCISRKLQIRNVSLLSGLEHLDFAEVISAVISL